MRTLPPRSSAIPFALVLLATLVGFPVFSRISAVAQASSALACGPCSVSFGSVPVGGSQSAAVSLTNTGSSTLKIARKEKAGPWAFSAQGLLLPLSLSPGQTVAFNVVFAPRTLKPQTGTFTFVTSTNSRMTVTATGTGIPGARLHASPASLSFGSVQVGSTATQSATISNTGRTAIGINQVSLSSGSSSPFSISGLNAPLTLAGGQSVTFSVTYRPTAAGSASGVIAVVASNGNQISISASGNATGSTSGQLKVSPSSLGFGNVTVGSTATKTLSLSASGSSLTVTSGSLTSSEFTVNGINLPLTLAAGQSVSVNVTFQPQSSGTASGNLTFTSSSTGSSSSVSAGATLTGTGTAAPQHSVALNWRASSSPVVGYNVYRGGQSGGPYSMLTTSPSATTAYSDASVQGGATYYYVVTSVDSTGNESVFSNQVQAVVPSP